MSDPNLGVPPANPQSNLPPLTGFERTTQVATPPSFDAATMTHAAVDLDDGSKQGRNAPRIIGFLVLACLVALFAYLVATRGGDDTAETDDGDTTEVVEEAPADTDDAMAEEEASDGAMAEEDDAMSDDAMADDEDDAMAEEDDAMSDDAMADDAMVEEEAMSDDEVAMSEAARSGTVVETLLANSDLSIVVDGIAQLGLDVPLSGNGPFTILAPANDSFFSISQDEASRLLGAEDNATSVLGYHVLQGNFSAENILTALDAQGGSLTVDSLTGEEITVELVDGQVVFNGSSAVVDADQAASNGVVHTISEVLIPPSLRNDG